MEPLFDTLWLEGGLFVPDLLEKASRGELEGQDAAGYLLPKGLHVHEEIGRAFQIALAQWKDFSLKRKRGLDAEKASHGFLKEFLRDVLDYKDLFTVPPQVHGERTFPIGHMARGRVPVILASHALDLDDADTAFAIGGSGHRKKSPFQLAQEYLNADPACVWALCGNGLRLRLLRDAATLTRPSYLEFDLEALLTGERYPDFAALWRLVHASRAGLHTGAGVDCLWEAWRTQGQAQGTRVRDGLRDGVTHALLALGGGFVQFPENEALRNELRAGSLSTEDFFQEVLRTVYRFLFLFTLEERELLHGDIPPGERPEQAMATRRLYSEGYSMRRLRERALRRTQADVHGDLWQGVGIVFRGLAHGESRLALPALGGLFAPTQCPHLEEAGLSNRSLLTVLRNLRWAQVGGTFAAVDYRNMGPEELGSVYESLLELVPRIDLTSRQFGFIGLTEAGSTAGNARKTTGSYYTPDALVQQLLRTALDPVIEAALVSASDPVAALLNLKVIDPACGSGHFLLAAARRLAEKLAGVRSEDGVVKPAAYRHALREVVAHCIYGVDRNPMALELARTALWLEGYETGQALSFLDHHLVVGDALMGILFPSQLEWGIPDAAYKALSGDDKAVCKVLAGLNKSARTALAKLRGGESLFTLADRVNTLTAWKELEALPDATPEQTEAKAKAYSLWVREERNGRLAQASDLFIGAFLASKSGPLALEETPTSVALRWVLHGEGEGKDDYQGRLAKARTLCLEAKVLHWPLSFPEAFAQGGFDCVLGNPPWERIKLQEEEFFASRHPDIAVAPTKAERVKRIAWLEKGELASQLHPGFLVADQAGNAEKRLHEEFLSARRVTEAMSLFTHLDKEEGGRFPLTGVGDVNTYALFSEIMSQLVAPRGRAGFIVPSGIATDDTTKALFGYHISEKKLFSLISFFEIRKWFPATDDRKSFCLYTLGNSPAANFIFDVNEIADLEKAVKWVQLDSNDLKLLNPNTQTSAIFRSQKDAELTKKIYCHVPILLQTAMSEISEINSWGISFSRSFHMSSDSEYFLDSNSSFEKCLPLYEAKMIHKYDHRWATFENRSGKQKIGDTPLSSKVKSEFSINPQHWVLEKHVLAKNSRVPRALASAFLSAKASDLLSALATWIYSYHGDSILKDPRDMVIEIGGSLFESLPLSTNKWLNLKLMADKDEHPQLNPEEIHHICDSGDINSAVHFLMEKRTPSWFIGFRNNSRPGDEHALISTVIPRCGVGNSFSAFEFFGAYPGSLCAAFVGGFGSLILDYVTKQKLGGSNLNFFIIKQLPVLPPNRFTPSDLEFITEKVLELTYTAIDMKPWAEHLGYSGKPFSFIPDRRALLRAQLDAYYARLYGLTRDELRYILDPTDVMGADYPSETFRVLKQNEEKEFGEYRTRRLVLEAWDTLS